MVATRSGKGNRQRFIRRARALRHCVREASRGRKITDAGRGGEITVPADGVHEPSLREATKAVSANTAREQTHTEATASSGRPQEAEGVAPPRTAVAKMSFASRSDEEFIDLFLEVSGTA